MICVRTDSSRYIAAVRRMFMFNSSINTQIKTSYWYLYLTSHTNPQVFATPQLVFWRPNTAYTRVMWTLETYSTHTLRTKSLVKWKMFRYTAVKLDICIFIESGLKFYMCFSTQIIVFFKTKVFSVLKHVWRGEMDFYSIFFLCLILNKPWRNPFKTSYNCLTFQALSGGLFSEMEVQPKQTNKHHPDIIERQNVFFIKGYLLLTVYKQCSTGFCLQRVS